MHTRVIVWSVTVLLVVLLLLVYIYTGMRFATGPAETIPPPSADRIASMTDEELAAMTEMLNKVPAMTDEELAAMTEMLNKVPVTVESGR